MKACFKCGETKPLDEFYPHAMMADGHLNKCKPCTKKDVRNHRQDNPEKVREYDRQRNGSPERVADRSQRFAAFKEEHPERRAAHVKVGNALRSGNLTKKPCAFCGAGEPVEAHHHDYSQPLDVTWLCVPCHRKFHGLERMATYRDEAA